jgi:hypothetical protein
MEFAACPLVNEHIATTILTRNILPEPVNAHFSAISPWVRIRPSSSASGLTACLLRRCALPVHCVIPIRPEIDVSAAVLCRLGWLGTAYAGLCP